MDEWSPYMSMDGLIMNAWMDDCLIDYERMHGLMDR